jgi:hypothetical protein
MLALFLTHWFHFFYFPSGEPWYHGNVWGNAMVILVLAPLGWLWSKTRFWPLNLIHAKLDQALAHHKHTTQMIEEMHHFMHTGEEHPRVQARRDAGESPTPQL